MRPRKKICNRSPTSMLLITLQKECMQSGGNCLSFIMLAKSTFFVLAFVHYVYRDRYWQYNTYPRSKSYWYCVDRGQDHKVFYITVNDAFFFDFFSACLLAGNGFRLSPCGPRHMRCCTQRVPWKREIRRLHGRQVRLWKIGNRCFHGTTNWCFSIAPPWKARPCFFGVSQPVSRIPQSSSITRIDFFLIFTTRKIKMCLPLKTLFPLP